MRPQGNTPLQWRRGMRWAHGPTLQGPLDSISSRDIQILILSISEFHLTGSIRLMSNLLYTTFNKKMLDKLLVWFWFIKSFFCWIDAWVGGGGAREYSRFTLPLKHQKDKYANEQTNSMIDIYDCSSKYMSLRPNSLMTYWENYWEESLPNPKMKLTPNSHR